MRGINTVPRKYLGEAPERPETTTALVPGSLSALAHRDNISLAESFLSVDALLIVDVSGSMEAQDAPGGKSRHEAAEAELRRLQADFPGKIGVICFSDHAQFVPTGIPIRMNGSTNLAGALSFVKAADGLGIKLIVISDGQPDDPGQALSIAQTFKSKIDTVYIGPEDGGDWGGRGFLKQLAAASGGTFSKSSAPGLLAEQVTLLLGATA